MKNLIIVMSEKRHQEIIEEEHRKEAMKKILPLEIGAYPKAELILVILGLKPATDVDLFPWNSTQEEFEKALLNANLSFAKTEKPTIRTSIRTFVSYSVAQTQNTADKLHSLDPASDHVEYGKLMGFPQTAIEGFVNKTSQVPDEEHRDPNIIMRFALSREHWQEEQKVQLQWSRAIWKYAPEVYQQLRRDHKPFSEEE